MSTLRKSEVKSVGHYDHGQLVTALKQPHRDVHLSKELWSRAAAIGSGLGPSEGIRRALAAYTLDEIKPIFED